MTRYGTDLDPEGYDLADAVANHRERPAEKSHPHHCAHCYYPWPCPTVVLERQIQAVLALHREGNTVRGAAKGYQGVCIECSGDEERVFWPCSTYKAVTEETACPAYSDGNHKRGPMLDVESGRRYFGCVCESARRCPDDNVTDPARKPNGAVG